MRINKLCLERCKLIGGDGLGYKMSSIKLDITGVTDYNSDDTVVNNNHIFSYD